MPILKYAYMVLFTLIVLAFLAAIWFGRLWVEEDILLPTYQEQHESITRLFSQVVWRNYRKDFNALPCPEDMPCPEQKKVTKAARFFFGQADLLEYRIYNNQGKRLLASERTAPRDDAIDLNLIDAALMGETPQRIVMNYVLDGLPRAVIQSYVPIVPDTSSETSRQRIPAILVITSDISDFWILAEDMQLYIGSFIIILFVVILILTYYSLSKTEKLITKQYEANIELITAKASAEEENREKSKFLANISHELRTPLNAIIGFSEIIKDEVMGPLENDQYREYIRDIHLSGVHLLSLINDILDYSKAEAGKLTIEISEVDVTKIMKNSIRLVSPRAKEAGVKMVEEIPREHFIVRTDGKRVKQVLLNILSNSVKFTPTGGSVTLYAWHSVTDEMFHIEIKDTGVGIAPKDISKVMATFGQVENQLSRKYEGTGLGLPLSAKLMDLMGGKLDIQSTLGEGTTVTLSLPFGGGSIVGDTTTPDEPGSQSHTTDAIAPPAQRARERKETPQTQDETEENSPAIPPEKPEDT